jgi:hypothetical protein
MFRSILAKKVEGALKSVAEKGKGILASLLFVNEARPPTDLVP